MMIPRHRLSERLNETAPVTLQNGLPGFVIQVRNTTFSLAWILTFTNLQKLSIVIIIIIIKHVYQMITLNGIFINLKLII